MVGWAEEEEEEEEEEERRIGLEGKGGREGGKEDVLSR